MSQQAVPVEVMRVLEQCRCDGKTLFLPKVQLDRKMYDAVNKVLEALGGKWNRSAKGHVFADDAGDLLDGVLSTGQYTNWKKAMQFFETPPAVADELVVLAGIKEGGTVLEPSAGDGSIVKALRRRYGMNLYIDACELDERHHKVLSDSGCSIVGKDFLAFTPGALYNAVVANPPFTRQQDISHVLHMVECCKKGGRVVSVMSSGVTFRSDAKTKEFMRRLEGRLTIRELPEDSFKSSGTSVSTVVAIIEV